MNYSYHNTTESSGQLLDKYEIKAKSQEDKILDWFKYHEQAVTPSHTLRVLFASQVPLTSVRRAMSNLAKHGDLVKTGEQRKGPYGRLEYCWSLPVGQQRLF